jgi:septal ring factor EnvC (AmiA/AmiB activator)
MADDEARARVAQLEKEKRQRDFQYSALESLLKKTKAENEGLKTKLVAAEAAAAAGGAAAASEAAEVQGPEAAESMQKLSADMMTLQVAHLYTYIHLIACHSRARARAD